MIVKSPRKFTGRSIVDVIKYAAVDLLSFLSSVYQTLSNLTFEDNFNSFTWTGTIPAATEVRIQNTLGREVSGRLLLRHSGGIVVDGDTTWTKDFVYLKNSSSSSAAEITVVFLV